MSLVGLFLGGWVISNSFLIGGWSGTTFYYSSWASLNLSFMVLFLLGFIHLAGWHTNPQVISSSTVLFSVLFFSAQSLFSLFMTFELVSLPVILSLHYYGIQSEKISAIYYIIVYTGVSGVFFFYVIMSLGSMSSYSSSLLTIVDVMWSGLLLLINVNATPHTVYGVLGRGEWIDSGEADKSSTLYFGDNSALPHDVYYGVPYHILSLHRSLKAHGIIRFTLVQLDANRNPELYAFFEGWGSIGNGNVYQLLLMTLDYKALDDWLTGREDIEGAWDLVLHLCIYYRTNGHHMLIPNVSYALVVNRDYDYHKSPGYSSKHGGKIHR